MNVPTRHRARSPSPSLAKSHRRRYPSFLSDPSLRFPLFVSALTVLLFFLSLFAHPDPALQRTFQYPSLLPSSPSPSRLIHDAALLDLLESAQRAFRRECPASPSTPVHAFHPLTAAQKTRYASLVKEQGSYMLVTTTRQIGDQLPDLLSSLNVLTHFLGPHKLRISILEGPSDDCTPHILQSVLLPSLLELGIPRSAIRIETDQPKIQWDEVNRIEAIAELRNKALEPLWEKWGEDTAAVVFFNDVYLHAGDVLELLYQHLRNDADITTGMDWWKKRPEYYYDVWVGRTIETGDLFYPIDQPSWSPSSELFHASESSSSRKAYLQLRPFQVYSSWNALAVLDPRPFLRDNVRFRRSDASTGECAASECTLIAEDYWRHGQGRVMVVPSVQLAYERDVALDVIEDLEKQKTSLGWKDGVPPTKRDKRMDWTKKPPAKVRCHSWPEVYGLNANIWEKTIWVDPYTGIEKKRKKK